MSRLRMFRAIAGATGESVQTIRHRGFSLLRQRMVEVDPELNCQAPQTINWDEHQALRHW